MQSAEIILFTTSFALLLKINGRTARSQLQFLTKINTIASKNRWYVIDFEEIWKFRGLLWVLSIKELKVLYAQTFVGLTWTILNPLFSILLLSFVFGNIANLGSEDGSVPHLLFSTIGYAGWSFFSSIFSGSSRSILSAQSLVTKIYFPRIILPLSKALLALVDLAVTIAFIVILMIYFRVGLSSNVIYFPLFLLLSILFGLGSGIWISALTIRFRDLLHVTPFIVRIGLFVTPIAYSISSVPDKFKIVYYLNPMSTIIEGMRWSLVDTTPVASQYLTLSISISIVLFISGLYYFNSIQRKIAEII